jgi:hypothetical protein
VTLNESVVANAVFRLENETPSVWQTDRDTIERVYKCCIADTASSSGELYRGVISLFESCSAIGTLLIVKALLLEASIKALRAVKPERSMLIGREESIYAALVNDETTNLSRDIMTGTRRTDFDSLLVFVLERMYKIADCVSVCNAFSVGNYGHFFHVRAETDNRAIDVSSLRRVDPKVARRPILCTTKHGIVSETLLPTSSSCVLIQEVERIDVPVALCRSRLTVTLSTPFNAVQVTLSISGDESETHVDVDGSVPEHILGPMRDCMLDIAELISRDWALQRMFLSGEADAVALLPGSDSFARGREQKLAWVATARFATKTRAAIDGTTLKLHSVCIDRKAQLTGPEYALGMRVMQFDVESCNAILSALQNIYPQIKHGQAVDIWKVANVDSYTDRVFNPYAVSLAFIMRHSDERFARTWKIVAALFAAAQSCYGVSFSKNKAAFVVSDYQRFYQMMLAPFRSNDNMVKRAEKGPAVFSLLGLKVKEYRGNIHTVRVASSVAEHDFLNLGIFIKIIAALYVQVSCK